MNRVWIISPVYKNWTVMRELDSNEFDQSAIIRPVCDNYTGMHWTKVC